MKEFLEFVIRQLVEFPDEVMLSEIANGRTTVFRLQMRQTDVGRIIGRALERNGKLELSSATVRKWLQEDGMKAERVASGCPQ